MKDTSVSAYRKLQAHRGPTLREKVRGYIIDHPGTTQPKIARIFGESARKRISELIGPNPGDIMEMTEKYYDKNTGLNYTMYRVRG